MEDTVADPPAAPLDVMDMSPTLHDKENDLVKRDEDNNDTFFCYVVRQYYCINEPKVYSNWHHFGGYKWRLLIFPRGNEAANQDLSVYLECGGPAPCPGPAHDGIKEKDTPPTPITAQQWNRPASFSLHVIHPTSHIFKAAVLSNAYQPNHSLSKADTPDAATHLSQGLRHDIRKETSHNFREHASDWGFSQFAPYVNLAPRHHADDDYNIVVMVRIHLTDNFPEHMYTSPTPWDSRKETGFVGFKNQGATCYMNSLLQTLYMLSAFRTAVYNMPLPEPGNEKSGSNLSYALQKLFYELQFSQTVVKTKRLTESFGWDTTDAFTQHDVQELKLILCDELAEKMKQIAPDTPNSLSTLFQGKILNYIECVNVEYKSTLEESFSDLSLNVKGCRNIYDSFEKYVEVEMMQGDNKYRADGFEELQDAQKGVKFMQLPPVLQLHLKRFAYNTTHYAMVKINDRYEFQPEIDLSRFVENSDGSDIYVLHSVLVHIGDVNGGHYHAFIRPHVDISGNEKKKASQWFKFDDENVAHASEESAVQENFGVGGGDKDIPPGRRGMDNSLNGVNGQTPPTPFQTRNRNYQARRFSNAYMLQYLRKGDIQRLLKPPSEEDVPKELSARIEKERLVDEKRKKERAEQHLYMHIAVATNDNMAEHNGCDLVNWETVRTLRVKRALQLGELKLRLQNEGIVTDSMRIRLWNCSVRQNETIRPDSLVANGHDTQPISDVNGRGPLTQPGFHVPLHFGRHSHTFFGQEDVVRMYAEDLCSDFCLSSGIAYTDYVKHNPTQPNGDGKMSDKSPPPKPDGKGKTAAMETDSIQSIDVPAPAFPLERGKEGLLFVKYYTPTPYPRLQWLGHFVVDRTMRVKDLHPLFKGALKAYQKKDPTLPGLEDSSDMAPYGENQPPLDITVFEEVSTDRISKLNPDRTLEQERIPFESGSGDILVFQENLTTKNSNAALSQWNGLQEQSRGDGTDLPLGGRPLPDATSYFEYLSYRIKIEFKDKHSIGTPDQVKSIFFELMRRDSYATARKILAGALGKDVDLNYLRFFQAGCREGTVQEPLRITDEDSLERVLPLHNHVLSVLPDCRVLWYEKTEYHITEFDQKEEVPVVWRQDGGTRATPYIAMKPVSTVVDTKPKVSTLASTKASNGVGSTGTSTTSITVEDSVMRTDVTSEEGTTRSTSEASGDASVTTVAMGEKPKQKQKKPSLKPQLITAEENCKSFSVLVQSTASYDDVMDQIRIKLGINSDVQIRMFDVKNGQIRKFINPSESIPTIMASFRDCGAELRAEPVPKDETRDALGEEWELLPVVHLSKEKQPRVWRGLHFFGVPFVVKVKKAGEPVRDIRRRIQQKLGVSSEEFDTWPMAEVVQLSVDYLEDVEINYRPYSRSSNSMEYRSLAIEHKSTTQPPRNTMRHADKPLKINTA